MGACGQKSIRANEAAEQKAEQGQAATSVKEEETECAAKPKEEAAPAEKKMSELDAVIYLLETLGAAKGTYKAPKDLANVKQSRDLEGLDGVKVNASGQVTEIGYKGHGLTGSIPDVMGMFPKLQVVILNDNQLTGAIPDFSKCYWLEKVCLHGNQLTGAIPDFSKCKQLEQVELQNNQLTGEFFSNGWPDKEIEKINVSGNKELFGKVTSELILRCGSLLFYDCKPAWTEGGTKNADFMQGPFVVGMSFASQNILVILTYLKWLGITEAHLKDVPKSVAKGGKALMPNHGNNWVPWQEVWGGGLEELRDQEVYILACTVEFEKKFTTETGEDTNKGNCFDASYKLEGDAAKCILDWERRQMLKCARDQRLRVRFLSGNHSFHQPSVVKQPLWYPMDDDFVENKDDRGIFYEVKCK